MHPQNTSSIAPIAAARSSEAQKQFEPNNWGRHSQARLYGAPGLPDPTMKSENPQVNYFQGSLPPPPQGQHNPPPPPLHDPYGAPGPRDPTINTRPHSIGHFNDSRPTHPPGERVQDMPPPGSLQNQHQYNCPSQQPLMHAPQPGQYGYEMYDHDGVEREQDTMSPAEYTVVGSSQKKRTPRTSQACEACRNAKAKCTDPKPCRGCVEKDIYCKYDPPAPKQADRVLSDILGRLDDVMSKVNCVYDRQRFQEKAIRTLHPGISRILEQPDEELRGMKERDGDDDFETEMKHPAKRVTTEANSANSNRSEPEPEFEEDVDDSDDESEYQVTGNVSLGEPAIPIGHTTGASELLQWPAVAAMVGDMMKKDKNRGLNPLRREIQRGIIRPYWRGEGVEWSVGPDRDSMSDYNIESPRLNSDSFSGAAHLPAAEQPWSQDGGQSPTADSFLFKAEGEARAAEDLTSLPKLNEQTVRQLSQSYMRYLNVMHPIITQKSLDVLITNFMQQIGEQESEGSEYNFSSFVVSEAVGSKRKRSPTVSSPNHPYAEHLSMERRRGTLSEAIMLLILALGKVCEHQSKIPDVVPDIDISTTRSLSSRFSPPLMHHSPQLLSHASTLPSPIMQDRAQTHRRSTDASGTYYPPFVRNIDIIPGFSYFVIAASILGNHIGSTGLPHVQACLLAGLYHSQLGRVLQSHAFVKEAGYALSIMLKQHLSRYKQIRDDMSDPNKHVEWHPKDNRIIFTFWTCLQLESDIVAELEVPQSDIMKLESIMPWPNLTKALDDKDMTEKEMRCYSVQLLFRKNLNTIHRELYGPGKEIGYRLADMNKLHKFPYINAMIEELDSVIVANPSLAWCDGDAPSSDILDARLRAKMYGAKVITYRPFLRMVLNEGGPGMKISKPILDYARKCINAMFHSAQAFQGITGGRLVVTNVWGTSHAQWGHCIVLHAAYMHPKLRSYVFARELMMLTHRVREFLSSVAHPSSALADDIRILDYATERSGAREAAEAEVRASNLHSQLSNTQPNLPGSRMHVHEPITTTACP